jgi:hypothetical protein
MRRRRGLTEDRSLHIPLTDNVVLDLWAGEQESRVRARSTPTSRDMAQT